MGTFTRKRPAMLCSILRQDALTHGIRESKVSYGYALTASWKSQSSCVMSVNDITTLVLTAWEQKGQHKLSIKIQTNHHTLQLRLKRVKGLANRGITITTYEVGGLTSRWNLKEEEHFVLPMGVDARFLPTGATSYLRRQLLLCLSRLWLTTSTESFTLTFEFQAVSWRSISSWLSHIPIIGSLTNLMILRSLRFRKLLRVIYSSRYEI